MNWISFIYILIGFILLADFIISRKKVNNTNKGFIKEVIQTEKFLKLQLFFGVTGSLIVLAAGISGYIYTLSASYYLGSILMFYIINYIFRAVSKKKGYSK